MTAGRPGRRSKRPKNLAEAGEAGFLQLMRSWTGPDTSLLVGGLDDDAAVLVQKDRPGGFNLMTSDVLIEGTHFTIDTTPPRLLGCKALAINLSDIAAMAGRPTFFTVSLGLPPATPLEWLREFYRGLKATARNYGATLCGGDTVRAERLTVALTLLGEFRGPRSAIPLRSAMKSGDFIYLTGTLGDSAAGLACLLNPAGAKGLSARDLKYLARRHQLPTPRLEEAWALRKSLARLAAIDLSDDLMFSLERLADLSAKGYQIDLDSLPISGALRRFASLGGQDPITLAAAAGEDFELLFACREAPEKVLAALRRARLTTKVTCIGRARPGGAVFHREGRPVCSRPKTYEHFAKS
jgi:thiamine-monophosphate kinase